MASDTKANKMCKRKVAIVYMSFPHYRRGVIRELLKSQFLEVVFVGSLRPINGIKTVESSDIPELCVLPFYQIGPFFWQKGIIGLSFRRRFDAIIFLSNPYFISTWISSIVARVLGTPVLFWGHGWLGPERGLKRLLRALFYMIPDKFLVYGERAKQLGVALGYRSSRIATIYNSLDMEAIEQVYNSLVFESGASTSVRALFSVPDAPLVVCVARLIPECRFDLLIEAAAQLERSGMSINVLLIGDGPERASLELMARELKVSMQFFGACYDERTIGRLIYSADLTVSPGKIGLSVIHSFGYGTPAISHGNLDEQMPEVEVIIPNETGLLFRQGDASDLACAIKRWFEMKCDRGRVRNSCREQVLEKWNPLRQREKIEAAVADLVSRYDRKL